MSPASCHVFPDWSVNVQLPAEPFRQPSMEVPLSDEVCVVWVVVVWVVVELVSGVVDWPDEVDDGEVGDGEVDDGDVDCCELVSGVDGDELLGEVCATAQTADNNRIAVGSRFRAANRIKYRASKVGAFPDETIGQSNIPAHSTMNATPTKRTRLLASQMPTGITSDTTEVLIMPTVFPRNAVRAISKQFPSAIRLAQYSAAL